jgi:hypothetical protein
VKLATVRISIARAHLPNFRKLRILGQNCKRHEERPT